MPTNKQPAIDTLREEDIAAVARLRMGTFFDGTSRTLAEDMSGLRELFPGDGLETAFVARIGGFPIGTVLLVRHELDPAHDLTPWLAGLVVAEPHRNRGIGSALVRAVEGRAAAAGVGTLYLYTQQARGFYAALGWREVETFEQDGGPMTLMSRDGLHNLPAT